MPAHRIWGASLRNFGICSDSIGVVGRCQTLLVVDELQLDVRSRRPQIRNAHTMPNRHQVRRVLHGSRSNVEPQREVFESHVSNLENLSIRLVRATGSDATTEAHIDRASRRRSVHDVLAVGHGRCTCSLPLADEGCVNLNLLPLDWLSSEFDSGIGTHTSRMNNEREDRSSRTDTHTHHMHSIGAFRLRFNRKRATDRMAGDNEGERS